MKLSLLVSVYRGGRYWRECVDSICANIDFFDKIYVSLNYSELQAADAAEAGRIPPEKLELILRSKTFSCAEHAKLNDEWLSGKCRDGFVVMFCHDDILCRDGLSELAALDLNDDEAVFGSFRFFDDNGKKRDMTVRQFRSESGKPFKLSDFVLSLENSHDSISISGLVVSISNFNKAMPLRKQLRYGWGAEHLYLLNPFTRRVHQTYHPICRIREHSDSEGARINNFRLERIHDGMLVFLQAFASNADETCRLCCARNIGYLLKNDFLPASAKLFTMQFTVAKLLKSREPFKIWAFLFKLTLLRIQNKLYQFFRNR